CDWYVEMSKDRLRETINRPAAQRVLAGVLDTILRLVHPVMPFVAESIWQALNETAFERGLPAPGPSAESVVIAPWPSFLPRAGTSGQGDFEADVSLRGLSGVEAEAKRLEKQLAEKRKHLQATRAKLQNESFVSKAPADVVQQQREMVAELENQIQVLEGNL